jgi:hypothetical protein
MQYRAKRAELPLVLDAITIAEDGHYATHDTYVMCVMPTPTTNRPALRAP